jgi:hypothetical protein
MIKRNIISITFLITAAFVLLSSIAIAQNSGPTVTQGYGTDGILQRGMIVGLTKDNPRKVEAINADEYERLHGVVITANESVVLLGADGEQVYVASGGRFPALVSSQNGNIKTGDYISLSSVNGIGMKAGDFEPVILGKAIEDFDGSNTSNVRSTITVKDSTGETRQLAVGIVTVDITIGKNPMLKSNNDLPTALKRASEAIAGKPVSPIRVYISLVIIIIAAALAGSLIYSAVRSSIIAIGRNPLSKRAIIRGLFQVVIIGLLIFVSGLFGVYLILATA